MGNTLTNIDSPFTNQYKGLLETQRNISLALNSYPFDLFNNEISTAVYERMMAFWYFNVKNCTDLGRKVNTSAADFFTETCLFFLKPCLVQKGLVVVSEKDIRREKNDRKEVRPDISIWKKKDPMVFDELVAVFELKVSDGWKGKTMTEHLDSRKKIIRDIWPGVFFGAISFWNCFGESGMSEANPNYIGLYQFDKGNNHRPTGRTIEQIIVGASIVDAI